MPEQLTLAMQLKKQHTFDRFMAGDNQELIFMLQNMESGLISKGIYLWGETGVGRTHLLHACCHAEIAKGKTVMYIPVANMSPTCLDAVGGLSLLVLDDIDRIIGNSEWEQALYNMYNQLPERLCLLVAGNKPIADLSFQLLDLQSRLSALAAYQMHALCDQDKQTVLKEQARSRGLILSEQVCAYLFHHYPRSLAKQLDILDRLDHASLVSQRKLTIPFIKSVLEEAVD